MDRRSPVHRRQPGELDDGIQLERPVLPDREAAISAGFETFGSDDFNVAQIADRKVVWFGWMDEQHPAEDRAAVAEALGLTA